MEEKSVTSNMLAKSVYSKGTSKVTKESDKEKDAEEEDVEEDGNSSNKHIAIVRMIILNNNSNSGAMLFSTALVEERSTQVIAKEGSIGEEKMEEATDTGKEESEVSKEFKWEDEKREENSLMVKMNMATAQCNLGSDKEGSHFQEDNRSVCSGNLDLHLDIYASDA